MSAAASTVLPLLKGIPDVTDISKTITPFISVLRNNLLAVYHGDLSLKEFYHNTNPFMTALLFSQVMFFNTFFLAEITRNYSPMDRLWPILPALYIGHFTYFTHYLGLPSTRIDALAVLVAIWSLRLAFNYFRKGGYGWSQEDYRWAIIRAAFPKYTFWLFNLTFIAWFQNVLLLAVSAIPAYFFLLTASLPSDTMTDKGLADIHAFSTIDLVFSRALILALIAEFFADQQQWTFQQAKRKYKETGNAVGWSKADLERGFCVTGLWSFSRHPNFLAEMSVWVLIYQWCCFVTDTVYNYAGLGVLSYCMLFQGSTWLTELISSSKYPEYVEYQKLVNRFLPKLSAFWGASTEAPAPAPVKEKEEEKKDK